MAMPSRRLAEKQALRQTVDLSAIANKHQVNQKTAHLDLNTFDATQLTLLEVLDMSEAVGVDPEALGDLMAGASSAKRMRLFYALAWCIARRADPSLTLEEVCTWKLDVIGEVKPEVAVRSQKRAAIIVGAATATGLAPKDAGQLTIAQLAEYNDRNRAARRRKR